MPAWSRPRLPAWVKRKKKKRGKKTKKKTRKKTKAETKAETGGTASHWLRELLKLLTSVNPEFQTEQPYHYDPRHYSKDPEYQYSDERTKAFKREIPAPDVHYFAPPGDQPPHLGNYSRFRKREDREGWIHVDVIDP